MRARDNLKSLCIIVLHWAGLYHRLEQLEERDSGRRLPFLYLANDILQRQEKADNPFELEFLPVSIESTSGASALPN